MIGVDANCLASALARVPETEKGRCVRTHRSCLKIGRQIEGLIKRKLNALKYVYMIFEIYTTVRKERS